MIQSTGFDLLVKRITILRDDEISFLIQDDPSPKTTHRVDGLSVSSAGRPGVLADQFGICSWYRFWSSMLMCSGSAARHCTIAKWHVYVNPFASMCTDCSPVALMSPHEGGLSSECLRCCDQYLPEAPWAPEFRQTLVLRCSYPHIFSFARAAEFSFSALAFWVADAFSILE